MRIFHFIQIREFRFVCKCVNNFCRVTFLGLRWLGETSFPSMCLPSVDSTHDATCYCPVTTLADSMVKLRLFMTMSFIITSLRVLLQPTCIVKSLSPKTMRSSSPSMTHLDMFGSSWWVAIFIIVDMQSDWWFKILLFVDTMEDSSSKTFGDNVLLIFFF